MLFKVSDYNTGRKIFISAETPTAAIEAVRLPLDHESVNVTAAHNPAKPFWVCCENHERCYGGPEEGGWGYTWRHAVENYWYETEREARKAAGILEAGDRFDCVYVDEHPSIGSVLQPYYC